MTPAAASFATAPTSEWVAAAIPGLRESTMFEVAASLFRRHRDSGTGVCAQCTQRAPCPARRHAALVISAAGVDPRQLDHVSAALPAVGDEPRRETAASAASTPSAAPADHSIRSHDGFSITGRGRALHEEGYEYQREYY